MILDKHLFAWAGVFALLLCLSACATQHQTFEDDPAQGYIELFLAARDAKGVAGIRQAARRDEPEALRLLATCQMIAADGCGYDPKAAEINLTRAVDAGSVRAKLDLCRLRYEALPAQAAMDRALDLCIEARDSGQPEATALLAYYALLGSKKAQQAIGDAEDTLLAGVEAGDVHAMNYLARAYRNGLAKTGGRAEAQALARRSAAFGSSYGALFDAYETAMGDGPQAGKRKAIQTVLAQEWSKLPFYAGWIGQMQIESGDPAAGFATLTEAAGSGLPIAKSLLAAMVEKYPDKAPAGIDPTSLYREAAAGNESLAMLVMAEKAYNAREYDKAKEWTDRAARGGQADAIDYRERLYAAIETAEAEEVRVKQLAQAIAAQRRSGGTEHSSSAPTGSSSTRRVSVNNDGCRKTGYGPGNSVACGPYANYCEKTGYGPGNAVACGGLANTCEKTGYGPGNAIACGGLANTCEKTGYGPGNDVACGGKASTCEKTGYGAGNDVSCGGLADYCERTGYGAGNREACGGLAGR